MANRTSQSNRGGRNNNPEGRNQYNSGLIGSARDRPVAAAAAAAAAVGAGVFLWSRRSQISEQLSNISDQIGEWTETMSAGSNKRELESVGGSSLSSSAGTGATGSSGSFAGSGPAGTSGGMSDTGSGNASFGAQSGGSGFGSGAGANANKGGSGRA